ncbi:MAG: signal peptidase II [Clostridiales bacterium]|nr:signal peptidase II [Clostridiales bacterium]
MITLYPIIAAVIIVLDQLTKFIVRTGLNPGEKIYIIGEWFSITFVKNTGAAFSMFAGNKFVTIALTSALILACLIFIIYEIKDDGSRFLSICLTFILAGGIGNLMDRVIRGYVTDMLSFGSFPVFNVADIFVTCGCFLTVIYIMFLNKEKTSTSNSDDESKGEVNSEYKPESNKNSEFNQSNGDQNE